MCFYFPRPRRGGFMQDLEGGDLSLCWGTKGVTATEGRPEDHLQTWPSFRVLSIPDGTEGTRVGRHGVERVSQKAPQNNLSFNFSFALTVLL